MIVLSPIFSFPMLLSLPLMGHISDSLFVSEIVSAILYFLLQD